MHFLMIANDSEIARYVMSNGVDRLFVDLEYMGKDERQKGLDTWKSRQRPEDVSRLRAAVPDKHLLVRINPPHDGTAAEVEDVIARGADSIMLPMFRSIDDISRLLDWIAGRAEAVPLVETKAALDALPRIARLPGLKRVHIGLNDLHLELGLSFMFQPMADGLLEEGCAALRSAGIAFGIGGLARAREGIVSPDFMIGEHVRLGSDAAILSRTFHRNAESLEQITQQMDFPGEVARLRAIYAEFQGESRESLEKNQIVVRDKINDVVSLIAKKKG